MYEQKNILVRISECSNRYCLSIFNQMSTQTKLRKFALLHANINNVHIYYKMNSNIVTLTGKGSNFAVLNNAVISGHFTSSNHMLVTYLNCSESYIKHKSGNNNKRDKH